MLGRSRFLGPAEKLFEEICDVYGIPYDPIRLGTGERLTGAMLEGYSDKDYAALLVNMDETSTGQLYDIGMLSSFFVLNPGCL